MSQVIEPKHAEATIAPATPIEEIDFSEYLLGLPDDPKSILELFLNPPEFNEALLRAKESHDRFFGKAC